MPSRAAIYISTGDAALRAYLREERGKFLDFLCDFDLVDEPGLQQKVAAETIRARMADCAAVLHIVGQAFGPGPEDAGEGEARRSFAQMEYDLAVEMTKPLHVLLLGDGFPRQLNEPDAWQSLQDRHREAVAAGPYPVRTVNSLQEFKDSLVALAQYVCLPHASRPLAAAASAAAPVRPPPTIFLPPANDPNRTAVGVHLPVPEPPPQPFPAENVVFTVYRPGVIRPERWEKLLFFAHLDEKPAWMDEDERTPIEEMEAQAAGILGRKLDQYSRHSGDSRFPVPRDGEITLVPEVAGVEFDPPRRSFFWREEVAVHGETFRLRAATALDGQIARGRITVFLGTLILAEIGLAIRVGGTASTVGTQKTSAAPFRKIFASYSHRDVEVVEALERHARTLGDEYLRDWLHLRSGEQWDARLLSLVEEADVFQLFWSQHSAQSPYVEREWRHALRLGREAFVRPTYWELPMPPPPPDLADIHFHRLTTATADGARSETPAAAPTEFGAPAASAAPAAPPSLRSQKPVLRKATVRIDIPAASARPVPQATVRIVSAPTPVTSPAPPPMMAPAPRHRTPGSLPVWLALAVALVVLAVAYWLVLSRR